MNYYERHIGDYLKDTAHLSLLEHGIYTRLLDVYYTREGAIPEAEAARLIGARSRDEREALAAVLGEFFQLVDGAHAQDRCEREIARFKDKQNKAKRSAEVRWGAQRTHSEGNANASPNAMRTHSEGNAPRARPQTPDTRHQTPSITDGEFSETVGAGHDLPPASPRPEAEGPPPPSLAGRACLACRGANVHDVNPSHPDLLRLLEAGVTPEDIGATAAECASKGKPRFAYVLATVERRRVEASNRGAMPGVQASPAATVPGESTQDYLARQRAEAQQRAEQDAQRNRPESVAARKAAAAAMRRLSETISGRAA